MKVELPKITVFIEPTAMNKVGFYAISLIKERTGQGKDAKGSDFKPYSTRMFAMPYGFLKKQKALVEKFVKSKEMTMITRDGKQTWVLIAKGYSFYKENFSRNWEGGKVNLKLSGEMMKAITVIGTDGKSFTVGWVRPELAERAYYNEEKGREFLGLTDEDMSKIYDFVADEINFDFE